jgi:hypothetical protein
MRDIIAGCKEDQAGAKGLLVEQCRYPSSVMCFPPNLSNFYSLPSLARSLTALAQFLEAGSIIVAVASSCANAASDESCRTLSPLAPAAWVFAGDVGSR